MTVAPALGSERIEVIPALPERSRAHGLLEGDRTASGPGRQRRAAVIFRRARKGRFASPDKIAAALRPPLCSGRCR